MLHSNAGDCWRLHIGCGSSHTALPTHLQPDLPFPPCAQQETAAGAAQSAHETAASATERARQAAAEQVRTRACQEVISRHHIGILSARL